MAIKEALDARFKEAMRNKDRRVLDVIRMVRARVTEARTAPGFDGEVDDALYQHVVERYVRELEKSLAEFESLGERGADAVAKIRFELEFLRPFLPARLDEEATRSLVAQTIEETGATSRKDFGRVMGAIMKAHRGEVDPALVRKLVEEALSG